MKLLVSLMLCCAVVFFSCTDRDDNLEGVQIRVQNASTTAFIEVGVDTLVFQDMQPEDIAFYQQYDSLVLPRTVSLLADSLDLSVAIDTMFELDSTRLHLFTYRIKGPGEGGAYEVEVLKD